MSIASSFYTHSQACPGMVPSDTQKQPALLSTPSPCSVVPSTHNACFRLDTRMMSGCLTSLLCSCLLITNHNTGFFPKLEVGGGFKAPLLVVIILPENARDGLPVKDALSCKSHWALWGKAKKRKRSLG